MEKFKGSLDTNVPPSWKYREFPEIQTFQLQYSRSKIFSAGSGPLYAQGGTKEFLSVQKFVRTHVNEA